MATGTNSTFRKSVAAGISAHITASSAWAYDEICHSLGSLVRDKLNVEETTLVYINVNNTAPYYGFVLKASSKVVIGILYFTDITSSRQIKFRDSSDDSAATYRTYTLNSA